MSYGPVIHQEQHGERIVCIRRCRDTKEFRCRLSTYGVDKPKADYFTDNLEDAKGTARMMARGQV